MKSILPILFLLSFCAQAQNLALNGDLESYTLCPTQGYNITDASFCNDAGGGSCDYYNTCAGNIPTVGVPSNIFGYQKPHSGNGYVGMWNLLLQQVFPGIPDHEYLQMKLSEPLEPGKQYKLEFYASAAENYGLGCNGLGMLLYTGDATNTGLWDMLIQTPHIIENEIIADTSGWHKISGTIVADQAYDHLIIGNFNYAIDYDVINPAAPATSLGAYYYIDDAVVEEIPPPVQIPDVFTPNTIDGANDVFEIANLLPQSQLTIYNRWGRKVFESDDYKNDWNGGQCSAGVYFFILHTPDGTDHSGTITIL